MRLFLLSPALFLLAASSFASSVAVTCDPPRQTIIATDQAQCFLVSPGIGSASASIGLELATDPAAFSLLRTAQAGSAATTNNAGVFGAQVTTEIHFDEFLLTAGSIRPGYLILGVSSPGSHSASSGGAFGSVSFQFAPYGAASQISCLAIDRQCFPLNIFSVPVILGIPLELVANGTLIAVAQSPSETADVAENGQYQFRFVEANGVTPVAVSETPEPSSALLFGTALLLPLILRKRMLMPHLG